MNDFEQRTELPDAWDHVYALDPDLSEDVFELVRFNFCRGATGEQITVPDGMHLDATMGVNQIEAATKTIEELRAKEF